MSNPFIGEIKMFAGNFAPLGWAFCAGQLLPIAENEALFQLYGTTYGGDGQTTFGLPDLRGRIPVHQGAAPGGSSRVVGQSGGSEQVTLISSQLPAHSHPLAASQNQSTSRNPTGLVLAQTDAPSYFNSNAQIVALNAASIGNTGSSQPHDNMAPFLCVNFIVALEGIFPSRA